MLNTMGLSMVAASLLWQVSADRRVRVAAFASRRRRSRSLTPLVRATPWLAPLPDPLEAYLRPAGPYSAFPLFPWAGFLFAGVIVGDLIDAVRVSRRAADGAAGLARGGGRSRLSGLGYLASFRPALFPDRHVLARLADVLLHPAGAGDAAGADRVGRGSRSSESASPCCQRTVFRALVTLGRSSLFVYWIHVEMVYGVIAEPIKKGMPLWASLTCTGLLCVGLYLIVLAEEPLARAA